MFDLTGKKALVTGSTQGIGKAIANCLAKNGAEVFIHGLTSVDKCLNAAREISGKTSVALADLEKRDCADILYEQCGDIDILVLNASIQIRKEWDKITPEEFEKQINVNLRASLLLIQKFAPKMLENGYGRIVLVRRYHIYLMMQNIIVLLYLVLISLKLHQHQLMRICIAIGILVIMKTRLLVDV